MPLTEDEAKALSSIIKEELQAQFWPFREEVNQRFEAVDRRFDEIAAFQVEVNRRFDEAATFQVEVNRRFDEAATFQVEVNRRFDAVAIQISGLIRQDEFFRDEVHRRFDEVATQIDGLYKRDEKREQEYLFIREQIRRLEAQSN
jgi:ribosome-associated translation inhibitor RaiA